MWLPASGCGCPASGSASAGCRRLHKRTAGWRRCGCRRVARLAYVGCPACEGVRSPLQLAGLRNWFFVRSCAPSAVGRWPRSGNAHRRGRRLRDGTGRLKQWTLAMRSIASRRWAVNRISPCLQAAADVCAIGSRCCAPSKCVDPPAAPLSRCCAGAAVRPGACAVAIEGCGAASGGATGRSQNHHHNPTHTAPITSSTRIGLRPAFLRRSERRRRSALPSRPLASDFFRASRISDMGNGSEEWNGHVLKIIASDRSTCRRSARMGVYCCSIEITTPPDGRCLARLISETCYFLACGTGAARIRRTPRVRTGSPGRRCHPV